MEGDTPPPEPRHPRGSARRPFEGQALIAGGVAVTARRIRMACPRAWPSDGPGQRDTGAARQGRRATSGLPMAPVRPIMSWPEPLPRPVWEGEGVPHGGLRQKNPA